MNFLQFWDICLQKLKTELTPYQYNLWLSRLVVADEDDAWIIYAPTLFIMNLVKDNCLRSINEIKIELSPNLPEIQLKVLETNKLNKPSKVKNEVSHTSSKTQVSKNLNSNLKKQKTAENKNKLQEEVQTVSYEMSSLQPDYTFENLVIGDGNKFATSAALAISEDLGKKEYNPFIIYGTTGLGKTHLAQSIANKVLKANSNLKIRYIHAEKFINDYILAVRRRSWDDFKKKYNSYDILILDDIQFIAGKEKTMEEFFYIFNNFVDQEKQIILTSDKFPKKIDKLDARLKSRFSLGLSVEIAPPEFEMRVAILHKKSEAVNFKLPDNVAFFIANSIETNVRELEGALNRVRAHCRFSNKTPDLDLVKIVLKDILSTGLNQLNIDKIQKTVSDYYNIKILDMKSKKRERKIARPRQMAMILAKDLTKYSLPTIGEAFGGRDHTTVIHACKTIAKLKESDDVIAQDYDKLKNILRTI